MNKDERHKGILIEECNEVEEQIEKLTNVLIKKFEVPEVLIDELLFYNKKYNKLLKRMDEINDK